MSSNIIPSILSGHNAKVTNSGDQIQDKFPQNPRSLGLDAKEL